MNPIRNSSLNFLGSEKNMKRQNQKISNPVRNEFLSGANGVKKIISKTFKFISSRLIYLLVGIFLAVSITYVYAAWNDAKTGDSGQLSQTNWNSLVNEIHNKCGSNCDAKATAATVFSDILTENNWNNLIDLVNNTLVDCTDDNGGKCFINQTSKSALDTDLVAGNIKTGVTIFGVTSSAKGLGTACTAGSECTSGYCVDSVCCNTSCSGSTCQRCDSYSNAGAGTCGYVSSWTQDPDNECPGAFGTCAATNCSGSGYSCGYLSGQQSCGGTCQACNGSSYTCTAATTNWGGGYGCSGSDKRCYNGSCITCGGWMNAGYCWYNGGNAQDCDTVCSAHGGNYNGSCDWSNDPTNCSTCLHFYPGTECYSIEGRNSGPCYAPGYPMCFFHQDGQSQCSLEEDNFYRQCACEK